MIQGIDFSYHQGDIDAQAVAASGLVNFVYMRIGSGDGSGGLADPKFDQNYDRFRATDLPIGIYHPFEPNHDPVMQFAFVRDTAADRFFELPIWLDVERPRNGLSYTETRARWVDYLALFDEWGGRKSVIYGSKWTWQAVIQGWWFDIKKEHLIDGHPLAVADYDPRPAPRLPSSWVAAGKKETFWQTNDDARVPGINAPVDVTYFMGTMEEFKAFQNLPQQATLEERVARIETGLRKYHPDFFGS